MNVGKYGDIFVSCDRHRKRTEDSLAKHGAPCVYEVIAEKTDKPCDECLIETFEDIENV